MDMTKDLIDVMIEFELPFYLKMSGCYEVVLDELKARVELIEKRKKKPTMPGIAESKNISLVCDDTSYFRQSGVKIFTKLPIPEERSVGDFIQKLVPNISLKIINKVIEIYRDVSEEYIIQPLTRKGQIGSLHLRILDPQKFPSNFSGSIVFLFDGSIGLLQPDLEASKLIDIKSKLLSKEEIQLSRQLFFGCIIL